MIAKRQSYMMPPPALRVALPMTVESAAPAFAKLAAGKYGDMDDKWDVIYEEPWLYLYRAGSGLCVFGLRFVRDGDKYRATEAWMSREADLMESDWIGHLGGTSPDANAAYLQIQLFVIARAASEPPVPSQLWERVGHGNKDWGDRLKNWNRDQASAAKSGDNAFDEMQSKLRRADFHLFIDNRGVARELLDEVLRDGSRTQQDRARVMLARC